MLMSSKSLTTKTNNNYFKGKGYGEGKLLSFALENSIILETVDSFFTCTGKEYRRNFEAMTNMINPINSKVFFGDTWVKEGHYSSGLILVCTTRQKNFFMTASSQHIKKLTILRRPLSTMYFTNLMKN